MKQDKPLKQREEYHIYEGLVAKKNLKLIATQALMISLVVFLIVSASQHVQTSLISARGLAIGKLIACASHHQGAIVTLVERKTGSVLMKKAANKSAALVTQAILELMTPYQHPISSITSDNGNEFTYHQGISQARGIQWYFAEPYASWQRSSNENTNGAIRQYFPKKSNFNLISDKDILFAMQQLNQRPRKRLEFKTAAQRLC